MTAAARRAVARLGLAGGAVLGSALSWARAGTTVLVGPIADGEPVTTSVRYHPQLVLLTLLLAAAAGVLAVSGSAGIGRAVRARRAAAVTRDTFSSIP